MKELNFYYIDLKYIRNLSNVDDNVMSISPQRGKQNRKNMEKEAGCGIVACDGVERGCEWSAERE